MKFNKAIDFVYGLRELAVGLELHSGLARRVLGDTAMMSAAEEIERESALVERTVAMLSDSAREGVFEAIELRLGQVKELRGTIAHLTARRTLDDVELFEVKVFALTAQTIRGLMAEAAIDIVEVPDTAPIVSLLDPDGGAIPHFAIHDRWSPALAEVRRRLRREPTAELMAENRRLEDEVRAKLSHELAAHAPLLDRTSEAVARVDILIAKARQALRLGLCRPRVAGGENAATTSYTGLFNPIVREALEARGKKFQPVDISFGSSPVAITGANMGGKTVLLRSVALAQAMFQWGFFVPAREAAIVPVDEILTAIGDPLDTPGLSSFASEMVRLDGIIGRVKAQARALVLIDEPARTTNPAEGGAIVNALLDLLATHSARALVTTHYNVLSDVDRLRVSGLSDDGSTMDYSLTPDDGRAPREALRIARSLGVDPELTDNASKYIDHE
jgi:dsDNA-specific endonuclease/ATPase MutS2